MFYQILVALLAGALLLMIVYCVWSRDERLRKCKMQNAKCKIDNEFINFHFGPSGKCDCITYGGIKFYPEEFFEFDIRVI